MNIRGSSSSSRNGETLHQPSIQAKLARALEDSYIGDIRVRMVECSPGYTADHWCIKGHILYCLEGELRTELEDGRTFTLALGMSFEVADNQEPHRSSTPVGARLLIVD